MHRRVAPLLAAVAAAALAAASVAVLLAVFEQAGARSSPGAPNPLAPCASAAVTPRVQPSQPGAQQTNAAQVQVAVCSGARIRSVPNSFLGISTEYWSLPLFERHGLLLARVLSLLRVPGEGPLIVRVGGTSADQTFWEPSGRKLPQWAFELTPTWFRQTRALVSRVGARLILDLNLVTDSPPVAARLAVAAERQLPRGSIDGFEIGNEPDLYDRGYWLATLAHEGLGPGSLHSRISPDGYVQDFDAYAGALAGIAPRVALVGPALAHPLTNLRWISTLLAGPHPRLGIVSAHVYPYSACLDRRSPGYPTISRLLSEPATAGLGGLIRTAARLAHRAGLPFRLTELNSVSCGGLRGVSNAFATGLWAPDALFELLQAGVDGVNVHVREVAINGAFALTGHGLIARPLLYGLILVARTLGPDAQLVRVRVRAPRSLDLKVWAVRLAGGVLHVLLIDKSRRSANLQLQLQATGTATVQRLLAPSASSRFGVTLDGQRLGSDGRWRDRRSGQTITPGEHGYELTIPRLSAALVSVHLNPGARVAGTRANRRVR